jgi:hypothetical protein
MTPVYRERHELLKAELVTRFGTATTDIQEGLRRLGKCFGQVEAGATITPL